MTYEGTMDSVRAMLMLGYSIDEAMRKVEFDGNEEALNELKYDLEYGVYTYYA